jgi:FAD/FMN-containing dehydrogenase/Fe-S oxidoreductase
VDESQREHIYDDLKGVVKGELLFDDLSRALYSTDASIFQVQPLGVVVPRDEEDVQALVRFAAENKVPLVPRGAGSGLAGEALGSGLIVDMSRHFRAIVETGPDTVRVQPGVVYRHLAAHLAKVGRFFPPDPASGAQCTIGGMLATNASGAHALRYGYTRDHVASLRVVLDTGDAVAASRHARWPAPLDPSAAVPPHPFLLSPRGRGERGEGGGDNSPKSEGRRQLEDIILAVSNLLEQNGDLIRSHQPRTRFNRCGYLLDGLLTEGSLDLARLLVGSEGTLGLFTEATLRTLPLPGGRSLVMLGFDSLEAALRATHQVLEHRPAACELIERRLLTLMRGSDAASVATLVPPAVEAVLLMEFETETSQDARDAAIRMVDHLHGTERLAMLAVPAFEPEEIDRLWKIRESALPSLYGLRGGAHPIAFVEDVGVPVEELPAYLRRVQEILQQHETTASFLVHAGTGQVHTRPFLDLQRSKDVAKLEALAEEIHGLALGFGGTVSTQHGTGLARTPWVARQYGQLYPVLQELKAIFDPKQIFNPGKIIASDPGRVWPLRRNPLPDPNHWHLRWQPAEAQTECGNCNGCGQCRTEAPGQRMCPLFRATHTEAATPRAKANLLRHLLQEGADSKLLSSDEVREVADLCVNCKMCAFECPAHVNIPKLMLEAKAANVAEQGLSRSDWVLARTESFAAVGSFFSAFVNAALSSRSVRWVLEKLFGVSRERRLPRFASRSFLDLAAQRGWTRPPRSSRPRVAYFVDIFANYNDPLIGEAVVKVLRHNGFEVCVPPGQQGCGMAALAQGDIETARETAQSNLRILADLARENFMIVCSEPTAALMLRHDCLDLLDDPDARLVAERTVELTSFLWDLHLQGKLRTDFQPVDFSVGHHVPCHLKALGRPAAGPLLLALIPGLRVHTIDVSCSGMAGTFGLKAENYRVSLEAGRPMLEELARPRVLFGSTECSTCRLQMEDGGRKRTLHPVQYLALAYGLMPELAQRLKEPIRDLVL